MIDKPVFYDALRRTALFGGKLTQGVVFTIEAILAEFEARNVHDMRMVAYTLATGYHESYSVNKNPEWHPVREGFKSTDAGAVLHVRNVLKLPYWKPAANGKSFYGRGYVQLTHLDNYKRVGKIIGIDLYNDPDLALNLKVAAEILVRGMLGGWFTGKQLSYYFTVSSTDSFNARRIINGLDRAEDIQEYYKIFYKCLTKEK